VKKRVKRGCNAIIAATKDERKRRDERVEIKIVEKGCGTIIATARNEKEEREERVQHGTITIKCEK
jgi:hypothetical protein